MSKKKKHSSRPKLKKKTPRKNDSSGIIYLLQKLYGDARYLQYQRAVLPTLLRAKIEISNGLHAQAILWAKSNIAMAEALYSALSFKSLSALDKSDILRMIVGLVTSVAERQPELVTPSARSTAEGILGCTLEEHLKQDLDSFDLEVEQQGADPELVKVFTENVKNARSSYDLEKISTDTRRRMNPLCIGDLEYFAKNSPRSPEMMHSVTSAISLLKKTLSQVETEHNNRGNVIRFPMTSAAPTRMSKEPSDDIVGLLEVLVVHPLLGGFDQLVSRLSESEKEILADGLTAQVRLTEFENDLILSHPDTEPVSEFVNGFAELLAFDPITQMQAMIDREFLFNSSAHEIKVNRSVKAVLRVIEDYREASANTGELSDDEWLGGDVDDSRLWGEIDQSRL